MCVAVVTRERVVTLPCRDKKELCEKHCGESLDEFMC